VGGELLRLGGHRRVAGQPRRLRPRRAGEPKEDSNKVPEQRQNRLTIRLQDASDRPETSNGLTLQLLDLDAAAAAFSRRESLPISSRDLLAESQPTLPRDVVRSRLYLYARCPKAQQPMVGTNYQMKQDATRPSCLLPTGSEASDPCPRPTPAQQAELDALCAADFNDRSSADRLSQLLGSGACLYLCVLGQARRGQSLDQLQGFYVDYGQPIAGLLSVHVEDGRAIRNNSCAEARGVLRGMFSFEVQRGRAGQSFP
jgi:hypothetical protein